MFIPKELEALKKFNYVNNAEEHYKEWLLRKKTVESLDYE